MERLSDSVVIARIWQVGEIQADLAVYKTTY